MRAARQLSLKTERAGPSNAKRHLKPIKLANSRSGRVSSVDPIYSRGVR